MEKIYTHVCDGEENLVIGKKLYLRKRNCAINVFLF